MGYDGGKVVIHKTRLMKIDPFKSGEQKPKDTIHIEFILLTRQPCVPKSLITI